jgi:CRP-like cAMP-binding protein
VKTVEFSTKGEKMKKYFEILKKCPLFSDIGEAGLLPMLSCLGARVVEYPKGSVVFDEGTRLKDIGIVLSGAVQIIRYDYNGNKSIIEENGPSELLCESFACASVEHLPVIAAASEDSEVMLIDSSHVLITCHHGCSHHNKLIFNLMKDLANKTILFHQKIDITSKRSTREKLMAYLMIQAKKEGNGFYIPFDRQELADFLEVERSGLSAEISKLKKEGVIENRKNYFELL